MYTKHAMRELFFRKYNKNTATYFSFILLVLTGILYIYTRHSFSDEKFLYFTNDTKQTTGYINSQMNIYSNILYGIRAYFDASQNVESGEWHNYVNSLDIQRNYPGATSFFYAPKVEVSKSTLAIYPETTDTFAYPITYLEPYDGIRIKALGFNIASEQSRLWSMNESVRTDQPTITPLLISIVSKEPILSIYMPIYTKGLHDTYDERKSATQGFAAVSFKVKDIFKYFTDHMAMNDKIELKVYDAASLFDANASTLLFDSTGGSKTVTSSLLRTDTITVSGRSWLLVYTVLPGYHDENNFPMFILVTGLIFSVLFPYFLFYRIQHSIAQ